MSTPLKKIQGRYEIKSVLGEGGMGVVYRAYDPAPMNREVALKTLLQFSDEMSLRLFYKECHVLKSMSHPNIVEIFDIGEFEDDGAQRPFFVMPLLRGQTLDTLIQKASHRLTVDRVVDIITQTCRGLQAAHEQGLIHRDLKPSNIFVMEDDSVKIIDFGVAHTVDGRSRATSSAKGTLLYMSPEQLEFKPVSPQSDMFSLAIVCYEALTRRKPFKGATEEEVRNAILKNIPPPASEINPAVSDTISRVIHKAMAKRPRYRFESAREFGEMLQKALRNQPIELFDPSRILPRLQRASKALECGDDQLASDIVGELEAEGNIDPQLTLLRMQIDQLVWRRTIAQLLESARARYEEEEDPLALLKIQEILELDPNNVAALGLKSKIDDRRSEYQIEKWLHLAREHIANHAYSHARAALENVLQLRSNEIRAVRLLSDIEADEKRYLELRQQKAQAYQSALNSWKNGEVSEALSLMGRVLELDRQGADNSSSETSAAHQNFYNQVRSEHDEINNGYAEAQRALTGGDYAKARKICEEFLLKYPNHALFQAFQFDIQDQQRQQLSALIAQVDRKLEGEPDLDAKVNLLRESLLNHPGEEHFERSLRMVTDKRNLVNTILARARAHEEQGQISEALGDLEILRTIYSPYPGLQFEIERLQKRREQQSRDASKARWVEQVDRQLDLGSYPRGLELVREARVEFPNDTELVELEKLANQGLERAAQAERVLAEGQELCRQGNFDKGLETLRQAETLDNRNPVIRATLRDNLVEWAQVLLQSDWRAAELFATQALEIDPNHALAHSIRSQTQDRKREEVVVEYASQARRLQAAGDLEAASAEVSKGLSLYPTEQRLAVLRDSLGKELTQIRHKQDRLRDLQQARGFQEELIEADKDKLTLLYERSQVFARTYPDDPELQSIAREIKRVAKAKGSAPPTPKPESVKFAKQWGAKVAEAIRALGLQVPVRVTTLKPRSDSGGPSPLTEALPTRPQGSHSLGRTAVWAAGLLGLLLFSFILWRVWPRHNIQPGPVLPAASVHIHTLPLRTGLRVTSPSGKDLPVSGDGQGNFDAKLLPEPGAYQIDASLLGYETFKTSFVTKAGSPATVEVTLQPLPQQVRIAAPDIEKGRVWLDNMEVGDLESGAFNLQNVGAGQHSLRIANSQNTQSTTIQFDSVAAHLPAVTPPLQVHELQVVTVSSFGGTAELRTTLVGLPIIIDGNPKGVVTDGLQIDGLSNGVHDLLIGEVHAQRKMSFEVGTSPAMDTIVFSDRDVGSILVQTGEDDTAVYLDNKLYPLKTKRGRLRIPNLHTIAHTVRVHKEGFRDPAVQNTSVVRGQESHLRFTLEPLPKLASLSLEHVPSAAQVQLDNNTISVDKDGTAVEGNISPGNHNLKIVVPGYHPLYIPHIFVGGEVFRRAFHDSDFKSMQPMLNVTADADVIYTIQQGSHTLGPFTGSERVPIEEGEYTITAHSPNGPLPPIKSSATTGQTWSVTLHSSPSGPHH